MFRNNNTYNLFKIIDFLCFSPSYFLHVGCKFSQNSPLKGKMQNKKLCRFINNISQIINTSLYQDKKKHTFTIFPILKFIYLQSLQAFSQEKKNNKIYILLQWKFIFFLYFSHKYNHNLLSRHPHSFSVSLLSSLHNVYVSIYVIKV